MGLFRGFTPTGRREARVYEALKAAVGRNGHHLPNLNDYVTFRLEKGEHGQEMQFVLRVVDTTFSRQVFVQLGLTEGTDFTCTKRPDLMVGRELRFNQSALERVLGIEPPQREHH